MHASIASNQSNVSISILIVVLAVLPCVCCDKIWRRPGGVRHRRDLVIREIASFDGTNYWIVLIIGICI